MSHTRRGLLRSISAMFDVLRRIIRADAKHESDHRSIISHIKGVAFAPSTGICLQRKKTKLNKKKINQTSSKGHVSARRQLEQAGIDRNHPELKARPTLAVMHHPLPEQNHLSAGITALHNACRCDSWNNRICPFMLQLANL